MEDPKFILELVGLFLTLIVMLYMIFGDNALFRIVTYTFIGIASGYVTVLVLFQVLLPRIDSLLRSGNMAFLGLGLVPFVLGVLMLFKLSPRLTSIGSLPMAILVGIGAAVAVGGALFGTLFGQVLGTIHLFNLRGLPAGDAGARLIEALFVLVGTVTTLAYFQFSTRTRPEVSAEPEVAATARRAVSLELLAKIGQVFIGITLGAMFAGVYTAAISALIERIGFVIDVVTKVMTKFF
jgi:hypothetical protein